MGLIIPSEYKQQILHIFDMSFALEVCRMGSTRSKHILENANELQKLYFNIVTNDTISLEKQIEKLTSLLNDDFEKCDSMEHNEILDLINIRNETDNIVESLNYIKKEMRISGDKSFEISDSLTELNNKIDSIEKKTNTLANRSVTFPQRKSDVPVIEKSPTGKYTENGKLMKEKICLVCNSKFNSNRRDAKYCSLKCRQAACREKKSNLYEVSSVD